jgi:hypothetical protein
VQSRLQSAAKHPTRTTRYQAGRDDFTWSPTQGSTSRAASAHERPAGKPKGQWRRARGKVLSDERHVHLTDKGVSHGVAELSWRRRYPSDGRVAREDVSRRIDSFPGTARMYWTVSACWRIDRLPSTQYEIGSRGAIGTSLAPGRATCASRARLALLWIASAIASRSGSAMRAGIALRVARDDPSESVVAITTALSPITTIVRLLRSLVPTNVVWNTVSPRYTVRRTVVSRSDQIVSPAYRYSD